VQHAYHIEVGNLNIVQLEHRELFLWGASL